MTQIKKKSQSRTTRISIYVIVAVLCAIIFLIYAAMHISSNTFISKNSIQDESTSTSIRVKENTSTEDSSSLQGYNGPTITLERTMDRMLLSREGEGGAMPLMGFGTCCRKSAKGRQIYESTLTFLKLGGRLIDTAQAYGNHREIGKAIKDSQIPRNEIFITSKIAVNKVRGKGMQGTIDAVYSILNELDTTYLDLCLIHSPKLGKEETFDIWRGLVGIASTSTKIRSIGVSNFNQQEILDLESETGILPEVNQIQFHPWTTSEWKNLVQWQSDVGIATTAYNSLGGSRFDLSDYGETDRVLSELATKYSATKAQILLKWALQQPNVAVIPGATSKEHIQENLDVVSFTFDLTTEECLKLEGIPPPKGWFDANRGPVKYSDNTKAWTGDHTKKKRIS